MEDVLGIDFAISRRRVMASAWENAVIKKMIVSSYVTLCLVGWSLSLAPAGETKVGPDKKTWDTVAQKAAIIAALREKVWPLWAQGKLRPFTYRQFPLRDAAAAHALMESSEHIGKILLVP